MLAFFGEIKVAGLSTEQIDVMLSRQCDRRFVKHLRDSFTEFDHKLDYSLFAFERDTDADGVERLVIRGRSVARRNLPSFRSIELQLQVFMVYICRFVHVKLSYSGDIMAMADDRKPVIFTVMQDGHVMVNTCDIRVVFSGLVRRSNCDDDAKG